MILEYSVVLAVVATERAGTLAVPPEAYSGCQSDKITVKGEL
jgi:hypothetical protein